MCGFESISKRGLCFGNLCNYSCLNVYKGVDLLKMFSSLKDVFESVGVCFENSKDVFVLKWSK